MYAHIHIHKYRYGNMYTICVGFICVWKKYVLHIHVYMYQPLILQFHSYNSFKYEKYIYIYMCIYYWRYTHMYTNISMERFYTHMCRHILYVCFFVWEEKERSTFNRSNITSINCYRLFIWGEKKVLRSIICSSKKTGNNLHVCQ